MKTLKQFLLTSALVILGSTFVFGQEQQEDQKKPKPKENPPVVVVGQDKNKPKDPPEKPRDEGKKKP